MNPNRAFELELRKRIDAKYQRESPKDNPVVDILNGKVSPQDLRAFYKGMWNSLVVFNRVLLARLLEKAPTLPVRCDVFEVVVPEFGRHLRDAHPLYFRNFLEALGVPRRELGWDFDLNDGPWRAEVELLRSFSWPQILARILVGESVGPKNFTAIADSLRKHYKLPEYALAYFTIHATHDKKDTEILFGVASRTITDPRDQAMMFDTIDLSFDQGRYKSYGCKLPGCGEYSYERLFDRRAPAGGAHA